MAEVDIDLDKNDGEIYDDRGTDQHGANSNALHSSIDIVKGDHSVSAICHTDGYLYHQDRDGYNRNGHQVENKPLKTNVVKDLRRVTDNVSLFDRAPETGKNEGGSGRPLVSSIFRLGGRRDDGLFELLPNTYGCDSSSVQSKKRAKSEESC